MREDRIRQVVIVVGGGTAGWMAAAITRVFEKMPDLAVTLVESEQIGSERTGSAISHDGRALRQPDALHEKAAMFGANGRVFRDHEELFTETRLAVMAGKGFSPASYHPAADILPDEETLERLMHIREVVRGTAAAMPTQWQFLARQDSLSGVPMLRAS